MFARHSKENIIVALTAILALSSLVFSQGSQIAVDPNFALLMRSRTTAASAGLTSEVATRWKMSVDGSRVIVGFRSGRVVLWDVTQTPPVKLREVVLLNRSGTWTGTAYGFWCGTFGAEVISVGFGRNSAFAVNRSGVFRTFSASNGVDQTTWNVPTPVSSADLGTDDATTAVCTPLGGIAVYSVVGATASVVQTLRAEETVARPIVVCELNLSEDSLYTCMEDYAPKDDLENGGTVANGGPTLWTVSNGSRKFRFGKPTGTTELLRVIPGDTGILASRDAKYAKVNITNGQVSEYSGIAMGPFNAVMNSSSSEDTCVVAAAGNTIRILRVPLDSLVRAQFFDPDVSEHIVGVVAAESQKTFATIGAEGGLYVYNVQTRSGARIVREKDTDLGQYFGKTLSVSHEFVGHSRAIVEIRASADGSYVCSKDSGGRVVLWTRGADGSFSSQVLPVAGAVGRWRRTRALDFWGGSLHLIGRDGRLHLFSLPCNGDCSTVVPLKGSEPRRAIAFRRVSPVAGLVSTDRGAVYRMSVPDGQLTVTLVRETGESPGQRARNSYGDLVGDPGAGYIVAVPYQSPSWGRRLKVIDTTSFAVLGDLPPFIDITWLAVWGTSALLGGRVFAEVVDDITTNPTVAARSSNILADAGIVALDNDIALCFSVTGHMTVVKRQNTLLLATQAVNWVAGRVQTCARARSAPYVYFGTESGRVVELKVSP